LIASMSQSYKLPLTAATAEFTEKKSRFIANVMPVASEDEALSFLRDIRGKFKDANHNVYAYRIKSNNITRFNDDGEPSGTAGMPLLDAFVKQDIYDFCCVATRYFGGIHLGAGGLVRAYSRCGAIAIEASGVGIMRELAVCGAAMPYSLYENMKRVLNESGVRIENEDFGAEVGITFAIPSDDFAQLKSRITELTAGTVEVKEKDSQMAVW